MIPLLRKIPSKVNGLPQDCYRISAPDKDDNGTLTSSTAQQAVSAKPQAEKSKLVPLPPSCSKGPVGQIGRLCGWTAMLGLAGCLAIFGAADQDTLDPSPWLPSAAQIADADNPETPFTRVAVGPIPRPKPLNPANRSVIRLSSGTPEELIGLGPELTINLLGEPSSRVEEASTRVWQYDNAACTLQLTLLLNLLTSTYQTVFYEVTPAEGTGTTREACLSTIVANRDIRGQRR